VKLIWSESTIQDLQDIVSYIGRIDPGAASRMRDRSLTTTNHLKRQPFMGRPGVLHETREAVPHSSYRIVYSVASEAVTILGVVHTARRWPPLADGEG
jgi:plasmid stabilization system protein ParE